MPDHIPVPHYGMAGISRATEPHLLPPNRWFDSINVRFRKGVTKQIPRVGEFARPASAFRFPTTAACTIPVGVSNRVHVVGFAGSRILRLRADRTMVSVEDDYKFNSGDGTARWAIAAHGERVYFTNPNNKVGWTDGTIAKKFPGDYVPQGRYITIFYDHLIAANVVQNGIHYPSRMAWSDVNKVNEWQPKRSNEADFYDCLERSGLSEEVSGITGMARMAERLYVYTPGHIYQTAYVGLPRVFLTTSAIPSIGCDLQYGVVSSEMEHFFPSLRRRNFYANIGGQLSVIGDDIINYFLDDLHPDKQTRQLTWSFYHEGEHEAWWVYISKNSSIQEGYDKAIIYSIEEKVWYPASVDNLHCHCVGGKVGQSVAEISGTVAAQTETVENLGTEVVTSNLWGGSNGRLFGEEPEITASGWTQSAVPFLETPDLAYDNPQNEKEVQTMLLDAVAEGGLEVYVSGRNLTKKPVEFEKANQDWTQTIKEGRLSLPRKNGKVLRYRFRPVCTNDEEWVKRGTLFVGIDTLEYKSFIRDYVGGIDPTTGRFSPPYLGKYTLILVGSGAGGGARALLGLDTNPVTVDDPTEFVNFRFVNNPERILTKYRGSTSNENLSTTVNGVVYPIMVPGGPEDPHNNVSQDALDAMYKAAIDQAKMTVLNNGWTYVGLLGVIFYRQFGSQSGVTYTNWLAKQATTSTLISPWFVTVLYAYLPAGVRPLREAGGGGSDYKRYKISVVSLVTDYIDYQLGTPQPHLIVGGNHTLGSDGIITKASRNTGINQFTASALGAYRGGFDGLTYFDGTDLGGSGTEESGVGQTLQISIVGDQGVGEEPPTGTPITQKAKGGRGFNPDGTRTNQTESGKGQGYGGGGCGQPENFETDLFGSSGGPGLVRVGYRLDPVLQAAQTLQLMGAPVKKQAVKQISVQTFTVGGNPTIQYDFKIRVRAVTAVQQYVGGTLVDSRVYRGGNGVDLNPTLKLQAGGATYFLNYGAEEDCVSLDYSFQIRAYGGTIFQLEYDNKNSFQAEPVTTGLVLLDTTEFCDLHEPQAAVVEIEPLNQVAHQVSGFEFAGFVDNVYNAKAEK